MIGKPNALRPSLKMTIPQLLLTTSKPLDITSRRITLMFWRRAKQTTIEKLYKETSFIFKELEPAFNLGQFERRM